MDEAAGWAGVKLAHKEYVRKQISFERYPASPSWPIKKIRDHEVQVRKYVSVSGNFHSIIDTVSKVRTVLECIHVLFNLCLCSVQHNENNIV